MDVSCEPSASKARYQALPEDQEEGVNSALRAPGRCVECAYGPARAGPCIWFEVSPPGGE
ncbi:hypothetical protein A9A72_12298 [Stutzerimonas stutzeri]|uniref:Uncharacterized protein n=1 Tax=Stutzerimonas stutzeri TaxID=316 RepID=A0A5S5BD44_STUST|nr:hypothetical protein A9A72_12298 [Stutzerimonas stutzeri]